MSHHQIAKGLYHARVQKASGKHHPFVKSGFFFDVD